MACCCCDGPGVCCQGTTCTSVNSCQCQENGGTFKAGRTCQQSNVCTCPGQPDTQVSVCEACPPGCTTRVCGCMVHPSITVNISNVVLERLPITGLPNNAGCESIEAYKDFAEGEYILNLTRVQAAPFGQYCAPLYQWSDGFLSLINADAYPWGDGTRGILQVVIACGGIPVSFEDPGLGAIKMNKQPPWACQDGTLGQSTYSVHIRHGSFVIGSATITANP